MNDAEVQMPSKGWPKPLKLIVLGLIAFHLTALLGMVLSSESGPWVFPSVIGNAHAPVFATKLYQNTRPYLDALRLDEDYRFVSNRLPEGADRIEVRLKDETGKVIRTLNLPDPDASPWTRHRQQVLVDVMTNYAPVIPPEGEVIPPPGADVPTAMYWQSTGPRSMQLTTTAQHLLPRNDELHAPTPYAMEAVRSISRVARRQSGARSAEIIWTRKPYVGAVVLMGDRPRPSVEEFQEITATFGEFGDKTASK